jgi:DNA polymerase-1
MLDLVQKLREFKQQTHIEEHGADSRVLLVDALNSYVRCFAATPTMNDDGEHIGGVIGFLKSVGLAVRQIKPSRVVLVFDGRGGSQQRRKKFSGYKDNRRTMEKLNRTYDFLSKDQEQESMKWQLRLLIELCEHLPVEVFAVDNIEADDAIAYLAGVVAERGGSSVIMSTDKDFLQLVGQNCTVYNPIKKKMYNEELVVEEYGVHPNNFLMYRMMVGDNSDAIPGIKGIGAATVVKLFPEVSKSEEVSIDTIYLKSENGKLGTHKKIIENKDILDRNRELMDLRNLSFSGVIKIQILEQFERPIRKLDKVGLTKLLAQYKMSSAFGNLDMWITTTWLPLNRYAE